MVRRYQQARKNDVSPMPLAGASGANGMLIAVAHATSDGRVHRPSGPMAKSHAPFNDTQRSRTSCGRGYPRPKRSNSPVSHSAVTTVTVTFLSAIARPVDRLAV